MSTYKITLGHNDFTFNYYSPVNIFLQNNNVEYGSLFLKCEQRILFNCFSV